jgi:hypothetical protein
MLIIIFIILDIWPILTVPLLLDIVIIIGTIWIKCFSRSSLWLYILLSIIIPIFQISSIKRRIIIISIIIIIISLIFFLKKLF